MTREAAEQEFQYDEFPKAVCSKPEMLFDISPLMERPLVLDTVTWSTTNPRFSVLKEYALMNDFFTSTPTLRNYLLNYSYFRCHACAYVTVTGTINHQGILLASVVPNLYAYGGTTNRGSMANVLMTAPHAVLGANEATSACIEIPFYVASDYLTLDATYTNDPSNPDISLPGKNNYADLILYVLNPLAVSGTTSTSVSVHVQIKINKLEVYTQTPSTVAYVAYPTFTAEMLGRVVTNTFDKAADLMKTTSSDFIDALRSLTKQYTGLHNPNNPVLEAPHYMQMRNRANIVDAPTFYEKMDPYSKYTRLTKDAIFHSKIDEMDMNYILSKPQYLGTFQVGTANTTGNLLWSRPISPWQGGCFNGQALTSNIERLYYNTQAWSGDMELIIQSSMTNKQNLKLLVAKVYGLDRRLVNTYPDYASARTGITSLLEFSAGNQQLVVDLDFLSRNQILYNTIDSAANALQHGMYYIFLAQPLVVADSVPSSVEFNVFLRCKENFRYYGYGYRPGYSSSRTTTGPFIPTPTLLSVKEDEDEEGKILTFTAESDAAKVMNEPSSNSELNHVDEKSTTPLLNTVERMYPISNLRDLIRRVQYIGKYSATANASGVYNLQIPISALAGLFPSAATEESPNQSLFKMYGGHNMGLRVKIRSFDSSNFFVQYYPPTLVSAYSGTPEDVSGVFYSNVVTPSSPYVNLVTGPVTGATYMELPTSWTADIKAGESGSVMDIHIPHTTIFHWWSGCSWTQAPGPNFENYKSALNNNGYLLISGVASPNGIADFEMFAGADDETRLGYHSAAPILFLPLTSNKLQYALPERVPVSTTSSAISVSLRPCYYSNLVTDYHTAL